MTTVKLFNAEGWRDVDPSQYQIKVASRGLGPGDRKDAEKRVDPELLHRFSLLQLEPDGIYVHKIAMGGSHRYGPNRWGDGFREEVLARDHVSFEQQAKAYRQHKSKGPFYGHVKLAGFRPSTGLVELVTEYYGSPELAAKHGGKVADLEQQMLAKKGYIPVSMGSLVPGDRCVVCGHWAAKPKDRCTPKTAGGTCELFGCLDGMLKVASDGRMNYVDNPINSFYDISMVGVGADPIANGVLLQIDALQNKTAGFSAWQEYATEQAESSIEELNAGQRDAVQLAYCFMSAEPKSASFEPTDLDPGFITAAPRSNIDLQWLHLRNEQRYRDTIAKLADLNILPTFEEFAKAGGFKTQEIEAASEYLPNLFTRLIEQRQLIPVIKRAGIGRNYLKKSRPNFALDSLGNIDSENVLRRSCQLHAMNVQVQSRKTASLANAIPKVVADYASMKLAFFEARPTTDPTILCGVVRRDMFTLLP